MLRRTMDLDRCITVSLYAVGSCLAPTGREMEAVNKGALSRLSSGKWHPSPCCYLHPGVEQNQELRGAGTLELRRPSSVCLLAPS